MDPDVFFTEPHYNGYPAILVRLAAIDLPISEAADHGWRVQAPKRLVRESEAARELGAHRSVGSVAAPNLVIRPSSSIRRARARFFGDQFEPGRRGTNRIA